VPSLAANKVVFSTRTSLLKLASTRKVRMGPELPDLANIAKIHCFPKNLRIFLAIFFNAKNLPF